ncbi:hypothetical protein PILCRDRAFT_814708 [Piloderma croceum F 1598]|uniref:Uncharacterized protein n=1 Tax=Piloderma croceum (strain F 1598) TaxID=765440 RepID=A0A0C3FUF1_PILCF|nr:hypothetical protein PILCRDRAFT_814708 [Piloderma croceum F 1598]
MSFRRPFTFVWLFIKRSVDQRYLRKKAGTMHGPTRAVVVAAACSRRYICDYCQRIHALSCMKLKPTPTFSGMQILLDFIITEQLLDRSRRSQDGNAARDIQIYECTQRFCDGLVREQP